MVAGSNPAQSVSFLNGFNMIKKQKEKKIVSEHLGDYTIFRSSFENLDAAVKECSSLDFKKKSARQRFRCVNQVLLKLILEAPKESYLLPAIIEYIDRINELRILNDVYHISLFEFWLNQFSGLSDNDNYIVRGKITGKFVPRDDYQSFFPIGMDMVYSGTHFVAAHLSPDIDTMIASFWGWVDAFSARVGNARHLWSLPGGPPDSPITHTFYDYFGSSVIANTATVNPALSLTAIDLVSQRGFLKKKKDVSISSFDLSSSDYAVVLIDEDGHFIGDWHRSDVEPIRQIIIRFKSCLRWFENNLHVKLISLFANKKLHVKDIPGFLSSVFDVVIQDCEPAKEFTDKQKGDLHNCFVKVLGMPKGLASTFRELNEGLSNLSVNEMKKFQDDLSALAHSDLFDKSGNLREDRPAIFNHLEKVINQLDNAIHFVRDSAERLDIAIDIKTKVLGIPPQFISMRNDVEDIRIKMQKQEYLTVVIPEENNKLFPVGVVWANKIQRQTLGTVTFRDFCNQEEVKMASYLTPISAVDHHKASLKTSSPPMVLIGDAQSCNIILAEQAFKINDPYSLGGMSPTEIENAIQQINLEPSSPENIRKLQRLLQYRVAAHNRGDHYVHPLREITEYLCFLHAILDDTDLLTKVTKRDIECVAELLNRIKSLALGRVEEVISLADIPRNKNYVSASAKRILKNPEMYSLYRKIYESKEQEVEKYLTASQKEHYEYLFVDTKEQNGCCRVGQTKMFTINFPAFQQSAPKLIEHWVKKAESIYHENPEIDLHIHMISTISSADEVYNDRVGHYEHQDQLWFWVPQNQRAYDHLASFLTAFQAAHRFGNESRFEFFKPCNEELRQIFIRNARGIPYYEAENNIKVPAVILHFGAGLLNSRKAMITPYLPRLIS